MRPAVGETRRHAVVLQHGEHVIQVVVRVVQERQVEHAAPVALAAVQHVIERQVVGIDPAPGRDGGDGTLRPRLVVRAVGAHQVHAVPGAAGRQARRAGAVGRFAQQPGAERRIAQPRHALCQRQGLDLAVTGVAGERVHRQLQPEQHAHRPGRHLGANLQAGLLGLAHLFQHEAPLLGVARVLQQRERQRPAGLRHDPPEHGEFRGGIVEVGDHLQYALARPKACRRHAHGDPGQLVLTGCQRGDGRSVRRTVVESP